MSKRKIFLASIIATAALSMVGCSGGGGSSSSVSGVISNASAPVAAAVSSVSPATWNESTDLRIAGVPFNEATYSASAATPPGVPVIKR
jgi:hypothetical protein